MLRNVALLCLFASSLVFVHCSDDPAAKTGENTDPDTGTSEDDADVAKEDSSTTEDAGTDAPTTVDQTEVEPNNGAATDAGLQVNALTTPGAIKGAIDPKDDTDIFSVVPKAGEFWQWTLVPGADLAPSLTVFDTKKGNLNPTVTVHAADKGTPLAIDQFVLSAGNFVAAVRDIRNVAPTNAHLGGPTFTYRLEAKLATLAPQTVVIPKTVTGKLSRVAEIATFKLSGIQGQKFEIIVNAARLAVPSKLDSRLSLFNLTTNTNVITNDDAAKTTDSEITGGFPSTGDYLVILENEAQGEQAVGATVPDLSYEIKFTTSK